MLCRCYFAQVLLLVTVVLGFSTTTGALEVKSQRSEEVLTARVRALLGRAVVARTGTRARTRALRKLKVLLRGNDKQLVAVCAEELKRTADFETRMGLKKILNAASGRCIEKTLALLKKKLSFEFQTQPLEECCQYFSAKYGIEISVVASPKLNPKPLITLKMTDSSLGLAIFWVAGICDGNLEVLPDGRIQISRGKRPHQQLLLKYWDFIYQDLSEDQAKKIEGAQALIAKRILQEIAPGSWGPGRGLIRPTRNNDLIVLHNKEVQTEIEKLWKSADVALKIKVQADTDRTEVIAACHRHLDGLAAKRRQDKARMARIGVALAEAGGAKSAEWLVAGLRDYDWEVRREALRRLSKYQVPQAFPLLFEALKDSDLRVRGKVAGILVGLKGLASKKLINAVLSDRHVKLRLEAIAVLGRHRTAESAACLFSVLKDRNADLRRQASRALAKYQEPWGIKLRIAAYAGQIAQLGDEQWSKRQAASAKLRVTGQPAIPALRQAALKNPDFEIVYRARQLLSKIDPSFKIK